MSDDKYDGLTIDAIESPTPESSPDFALRILWSAPQIGFGAITLFWDGNQLCADTEHMGDELIKRLLSPLADQIEIRG